MNLYKAVSRISKLGKYLGLLSILMLLVNFSLVWADQGNAGGATIATTLANLCKDVKSFLGVGMVLMILLAAVIYAVGQIMGAETRARATVWATAMLTGAIIAAVIYVIAPEVIKQIVAGGQAGVTLTC